MPTWILSDDAVAAAKLAQSLSDSRSPCHWISFDEEILESRIPPFSRLIVWRRLPPEPESEESRVLFRHMEGLRIKHLILLSSAEVYAPSPRHPGMVLEGIKPAGRGNLVSLRWIGLEELASRLGSHSETTVSILRLPIVLEGVPRRWSRFFGARWASPLPGYDPPLQFLSWRDLVAAIELARNSRLEGLFHVCPKEVVPLRKALRLMGARALPLPGWLQRGWFRLTGNSLAVAALAYGKYPWTIFSHRVQDQLGFEAGDSSTQALLEFRRLLNRDAPPDLSESCDDYGMDRSWIDRLSGSLFGFLEKYYWRISVSGLEKIRLPGRSFILVGIHRGYIPVDAIMTLHVLASRLGIYPRFLVHPGLLKFPFIFNFIIRMGGVIACRENARRILDQEQVLGVFPEGVKAAFGRYRDAYRVGRFLNREFIRLAIEYQVPIVPYVVLGPAESLPVLAQIHWKWWQRYADWPCIPVGPPLPLPGKWRMEFLEPLAPPQPMSSAARGKRERDVEKQIRGLLQGRLDARAGRPEG